MKKVAFLLLVLAGSILTSTDKVQAQQMKIGVFDIDLMVQAMPKYRSVDSLVQIYERDSLASEYSIYQNEYRRLDSTYKADSAAKKSNAVLDYTSKQRQQIALNLVYWQQIAQNKSEQKRAILAQPLYEQVVNAYKKVLDQKKYGLVLKPNTFEGGSQIENIFPMVAKELKVQLPPELDPEQLTNPNTPPPATTKPTTKPAGKG